MPAPTPPRNPLTPGAPASTASGTDAPAERKMGIPTPVNPGTAKDTAAAGTADQVAAQQSRPDGGESPVKPTPVLAGSDSQKVAAMEQQIRDMARTMADMQRQMTSTAKAVVEAKKLPTVEKAMEDAHAATDAIGRRPVLTEEGWYAHPHAYEQPNGDLTAVLAKLGAGASMPTDVPPTPGSRSSAPKVTARASA